MKNDAKNDKKRQNTAEKVEQIKTVPKGPKGGKNVKK